MSDSAGRVQTLIDAAARAMCNADEQGHLRLERRDGMPCRLHENAAYVAVEALMPLIAPASTLVSGECDEPA